jgi:hypothetical protein
VNTVYHPKYVTVYTKLLEIPNYRNFISDNQD